MNPDCDTAGDTPTRTAPEVLPLGPAPHLTFAPGETLLDSTHLQLDSGKTLAIFEVAESDGMIRTAIRTEGLAKLSRNDVGVLCALLLGRSYSPTMGASCEERTLSAVEVLETAKARGWTHVTSIDRGLVPLDDWLIYGKAPALSCARFRQQGDGSYVDASQPHVLRGGWTFRAGSGSWLDSGSTLPNPTAFGWFRLDGAGSAVPLSAVPKVHFE